MKKILFVCIENAARSQMAEAIFNKFAVEKGISARALSAGTKPASEVNPLAIQVLKEMGIDITHKKPRPLTQEMIKNADKIITMGCLAKNVCPAIFLAKTVDWRIEDPSGKLIEKFREVMGVIKGRVEELLSKHYA